MPSTSQHIMDIMNRWFQTDHSESDRCIDGEAVKVLLSQGFLEHKGMIYPEVRSRSMTSEQWTLITYLCEEWDYAYDPNFVPNAKLH